MRYLRTARHERVRDALSRAEPEESVAEIAAKWGFTHMGRFSVDYRGRFDEPPLRRCGAAAMLRPDRRSEVKR
jgi:transcriptional regulator GlxA family with amidase domain